jgi:RNA polymerase sigma-70 factor (family 1)
LLWQQGGHLAFAEIYKRYALELLSIAIDKTRDRDVAEELVQDTFVAFYKSSFSIDKMNSVLAFLYIILKNKIMDWHRYNLRQRTYADYFGNNYEAAEDSTGALVQTRELERFLHDEIEKLPQQCGKVFKMRRQDFKSNKDIALLLQISENTVEQHMRRALRLLRISFINHDLLFLFLVIQWPGMWSCIEQFFK